MRIGEVARSAGVGVETLRYYERRGLLTRPSRTASGYRLFPTDEPRRVRFIRRAQALGFTLAEIQRLIALRVISRQQCASGKTAAVAALGRIRAKREDLQRMERALRSFVRRCDAGRVSEECPMLIALEREEAK